jgi:hypothetical protein
MLFYPFSLAEFLFTSDSNTFVNNKSTSAKNKMRNAVVDMWNLKPQYAI